MVKMKTVIYHGNCYDGVTAAWVCHKALDPAFEGMNSDVEYIPINYSDPPPNVIDRDVIIVDFSFKRPVLEGMKAVAKSLIVLDHHKSAMEDLKDLPYAHFDMEKSGAGLAWDHFFPGSGRPDLVNYIEDRDLWRFKLPSSKEINAWIQSFDIDLSTWIYLVGPQFDKQRAFSEGVTLLRLENKYVKQICYNARLKEIAGYIVPYVETSILMSEVCDYLLKEYPNATHSSYPFVAYSFRRRDGKYQYGMRSRGDFDVSLIARQFSGGGHKNAAGFERDEPL